MTHDNVQIRESASTKFLGITLDQHLSWKQHINEVCNKINRFIYALYRLKNICDQKTALLAYHGYVCSALRYGLAVWGNSVDMKRVFIMQKKCVRAMCGVGPFEPCGPLFKKLNLLTLPCMYILELCMLVKKNMYLFERKRVVFYTRYPNSLVVPPQRTACFAKNSYCMSVKVFNVLPENVKTLPETKFKTTLYSLLLENCFYTVEDFLNYAFDM